MGTGGRWCDARTTWGGAGASRPRGISGSRRGPTPRWPGCGSSSRPATTSRARSGPGWSRRRCSAPTTAGRRSSWSRGCGTIRTGRAGSRGVVGCACTRSCQTRPTRTGCGSPSPPAGSTGPTTVGTAGRPATTASGPCSCLTSTPSSDSACTRSPRPGGGRTGCISRTTGACTAAMTGATTGRTWPTGCRATSASPWSPTQPIPTPPGSSRWTLTSSAAPPTARPGCTGPGTRGTPGRR
jgi:hypothetical protein